MTRKRHPHAHFKKLTADEAGRALYIDFEGQTNQVPVLLGTFSRGRGPDSYVHQVVLDPVFGPAGPETRAVRTAIETVVMRAEKDRRIVAWSEHELNVINRLIPEDRELTARFEARYANARLVARRWMQEHHPEAKPAENTLAAYLEAIDWNVPPGAGRGRTGDTIRLLRPTLAAGRPLTALQRGRWADLLTHNRHDCAGMRAICLEATEELESV